MLRVRAEHAHARASGRTAATAATLRHRLLAGADERSGLRRRFRAPAIASRRPTSRPCAAARVRTPRRPPRYAPSCASHSTTSGFAPPPVCAHVFVATIPSCSPPPPIAPSVRPRPHATCVFSMVRAPPRASERDALRLRRSRRRGRGPPRRLRRARAHHHRCRLRVHASNGSSRSRARRPRDVECTRKRRGRGVGTPRRPGGVRRPPTPDRRHRSEVTRDGPLTSVSFVLHCFTPIGGSGAFISTNSW